MRFFKAFVAVAAGLLLGTWLPFVVHEYGHAIGALATGVEVHYIKTSPFDPHVKTDGANLATVLGGVVSTTVVGAAFPFVVRKDGPFWVMFGSSFMVMSLYIAVAFLPIRAATDGTFINAMTEYGLAIGVGAFLIVVSCAKVFATNTIADLRAIE